MTADRLMRIRTRIPTLARALHALSHSAGNACRAMSDWASQKSAGNSFYTSGNVDAAVSAYTTALADEELPSAERATILCNRAQCFLKNKAWTSAVEDCTACLMVAPNNVKALFRRYVWAWVWVRAGGREQARVSRRAWE
ncbi:hypothetical protein EON68_01590, partial [archaeon]